MVRYSNPSDRSARREENHYGQKARRVLLLGSDGADWKMINPLLEKGQMPNLQRLIESGVMGNVVSLNPMPSPNPIEYRDVGSDTTNDQITPGNIGQLSGNRLKFDPAQADEGLYFVPTADTGDVKVTTIQKNKPSQLVFLVPALVAGGYNLEVRARIAGGTELRIGRLDPVLTA